MASKAKQTFFIRAQVNGGNTSGFAQSEIDIGSYTDLGSSSPEILRIHNIHCYVTDSAGEFPNMTGDAGDSASWQLTTQSQTALVLANDRSFVAGGVAAYRNADSTTMPPAQAAEQNILPQDWVNGYLVAVPTLFLGGLGGTQFTEDVYFTIVMECSTEKASKGNAVSLAVSQQ
jgi:hypothetical protein